MLVYTATKKKFDADIQSGSIADIVKNSLFRHGIYDENDREFVSWENSLAEMQRVLDDSLFSPDIQIGIECQIPQTSKRVDFIIAGINDQDKENVVIVELKQWERAHRTERDGIVSAFTGGMVRAVAHPSYQAYSYAKIIENFSATVQDKHIDVELEKSTSFFTSSVSTFFKPG